MKTNYFGIRYKVDKLGWNYAHEKDYEADNLIIILTEHDKSLFTNPKGFCFKCQLLLMVEILFGRTQYNLDDNRY